MKENLYYGLVDLIAPKEINKYFEISTITETKERITIVFEEKPDLIPKELEGKDAILDGFLNSLELQTFPLKDKLVYLSLKRRKWKERNKSNKSYTNTYNLHREGMKTTRQFGDFLKEELGLSPSEYNKLWESATH